VMTTTRPSQMPAIRRRPSTWRPSGCEGADSSRPGTVGQAGRSDPSRLDEQGAAHGTMGRMESFGGKKAVVTGGGSGMGRELVVQLAAEGCDVATCDVSPASLEETRATALAGAPEGTVITTHTCDVSDEAQVLAFRDAVVAAHGDRLNLVFNNAGIGGGGSLFTDSREVWERTFAVDWWGVYYCTRAFLPLLANGDDGYLVNTSSVNGFWASLGPGTPHTAY